MTKINVWLTRFAILAGVLGDASWCDAQQPYWTRSGATAQGEATDPFRPYGSSTARTPQPARDSRSAPATVQTRPEPTRTNFYAQRRNYFPGQRVGQGPNQNVSYGRSHCTPSRTAMFVYAR